MSISDFTDLMPHTVYHASFAGRDSYAVPVYDSQVGYTARVTYKPTMVKRPDGSEVLAKGVVWLATIDTVTAEDQIELPDGSTPPILSVDIISDETGTHHIKVYFG